MHDIVKADVVNVAGELGGDTLNDAAWADILAYVNQFKLRSCDSDCDRRLARIYLAAHIATVSGQGVSGAAGAVMSEAVGGVKRTYAAVSPASAARVTSTTRYGQQYESFLTVGPMLI